MSASSSGALVAVLLGVRFVTELSLLAAPFAVAAASAGGPSSYLVALVGSAVIATAWGTFLAPRRRVDTGLAVRVALEAVIVAAVAASLAAVGLVVAASVLVVVEVVTLTGLAALGLPPGSASDATTPTLEGAAR